MDAQKSKLDRVLRGTQDELARIEAEGSARLRDLAEREQALADLCDQTVIAERNVMEAKTYGRVGLDEVQKQIAAMEESNRVLAQRIAAKKAQMESADTEEERARKKAIDDREDQEDAKVEREWVASESALKSRVEQVKAQVDEANREYREALALLVQAREMNTSTHSPAPGKPRPKKPRSRRSRQKALSMIGANASSPSLTTSDPSISSRPASLALPTGTDVGMFYTPDYPEVPLPYEYSSGSPWASTHSLGLKHEVPLVVDTDLDRDRLTGEALLSPSVSEHLLPSNLFGPDEDSIRTSPYIDQLLQSSPPTMTPRIPTVYPPIARTADSPVSEMSTRSSFSSPNQSHPALPLRSDPIYQESQQSPSILLTHYSNDIPESEEPVEVTSPAELNGVPLSAYNTEDDDVVQETTSPAKYWKIPSLSFKRKPPVPPEKRLPLLGSLKPEKASSMPRTLAGVTPIGFNRPRSGSGASSGWLQNVTRARAPSETGRQFDTNFDPLESRSLLEGAGVVHHHSALARPAVFDVSPRASFDSRSSIHRRSTETDIARAFSPGFFGGPSVYSEITHPYGWMSQSNSTPLMHPPLSLPTSPSVNTGRISIDRWSPPDTSRSSLDPKAPEFRMSLLAPEPEPEVIEDISPKRAASRFALTRRSTIRSQGDSFLNNFTGFFRRDTKPGEDEENDLTRPKSQDTQNSGDPSIHAGGSMEDLTSETSPDKKKKEKKKKEKSKGKGLFRWESKTDISEEPDLMSLYSSKEEQEAEDTPKKKEKKQKKGKKGVKFEKEEGDVDTSPSRGEGGPYYYQGREVTLDDKFLSSV